MFLLNLREHTEQIVLIGNSTVIWFVWSTRICSLAFELDTVGGIHYAEALIFI